MYATRTIIRASRTARPALRLNVRNARFESTQATAAKTGGSSGLVGGLVGGGLVFIAGYGYYHMSGAKTLVNAAASTKKQFQNITASLKSEAPEPNELLKWFRQTVTGYAAFIPGAKSYVDQAFNDLDTVEKNHRGEVDQIVKKAYRDLQQATKSGLTVETAQMTWEVLEKALKDLSNLAADSASELLDNHPELKDKVGGNMDQLKSLGDKYGPEAKKEIDQTYQQIKDVIAGGVGAGSIAKIKGLIEEKIQKVQKLGDEAWKKGMEEAKPYLDKKPEIKDLVEKNADALKSSNLQELWEKVKNGDTQDLEKFVKDAGEKAKNTGFGKEAEKYMKMIPGGSEIIPKLQKLQEVAKKHGKEAESLLKETYKEVAGVLEKKTKEAEKLGDKAKEDAKK